MCLTLTERCGPNESSFLFFWLGECPRSLVGADGEYSLILRGMTVHKAQGSSLERVKVDLQSTFADGESSLPSSLIADRADLPGQAYVALSRATCLEGLEVANYNSSW
jgi:ATP-dependent DNA helicase PIF1